MSLILFQITYSLPAQVTVAMTFCRFFNQKKIIQMTVSEKQISNMYSFTSSLYITGEFTATKNIYI